MKNSKIVIFEGPDNVGKGTQISKCWKKVANSVDEYGYPFWWHYANFGIEDNERCKEQSALIYTSMFRSLFLENMRGNTILVDRSHLGEWVYGYIYRNYEAEFIWSIEEMFNQSKLWDSVYLITFIDEPENLIKRDDGLSFSTDLEKKKLEVARFVDAHERSRIVNKCLIDIKGKDETEVWKKIEKFVF